MIFSFHSFNLPFISIYITLKSSLLKSIKYIILFTFLAFYSNAFASNTNIQFESITINDGLSLSSVYCVFKDSKGFMWFGTEDGLNRFDGKNFKIFRANPYDTNSISYKWIESVFEDSNSNLWFGSKGGLTFYNPVTEKFIQYKQNKSGYNRISNDTITTIFQTNKEKLIVGTLSGLNIINLTTNKNEIISDKIPELSTSINSIIQVNEDLLLIGTGKGLFSFSILNNSIEEQYLRTPITIIKKQNSQIWIGSGQTISTYNIQYEENTAVIDFVNEINIGQHIENILIDEDNQTWIATDKGLLYLKAENKTIHQLINSTDLSHSLAIRTNKPLLQDKEGTIWFGTFGNGVYKINPQKKTTNNYRNNKVDLTSLSENSINCIYEDSSGTIWFGTFGAGISAFNSSWQKFELIKHDPLNPNSLSSNFVWTILEDTEGKVWIGTNDCNISIYNPVNNNFETIEHIPGNPNSLPHSSVKKIFQDRKGIIWIGTDGGGLSKYNPGTKKFIHYKHNPEKPGSISNNSVRVIMEDSKSNIWVGTRDGLNKLDRNTGRFIVYKNEIDKSNSISHNFIYSAIHEDKNGYLWIGTYGGGLNRFDPKTESFIHYKNDPNKTGSISDNIVFSIYETPEGNFWIGTNSGLNLFNPKKEIFKYFGTANGLPNDVIYGVLPDNEGNIWLSTNLGISRFNIKSHSARNFSLSDGLQSVEFNGGAFHKGISGKLYFGGVYGLNIIDIDKLNESKSLPKVVFTKLEILGQEVSTLPNSQKSYKAGKNKISHDSSGFYLPTNISYSNQIILNYSNRNFSLEYNELTNPLNKNNNFAYFVENLDKKWNYSGNRNFVSFANLRHGSYTIKVKAQDENGSWNTPETSLSILIKPPFYKTWWFIVFEILVLGILTFLVYKYLVRQRTYNLLRKHNDRINKAYIQLKESEQALFELNATKDKFFSIISHDLKNPFASLMSISEMMKDNFLALDEEEKHTGIHRIHGSIENIFSLLDNLLTWARSQSGRIDFNPSDFNMSKILQENLNLFRLAADKKKVKLVSEFADDLTAFGDREMINTVVRNLVNNAIKFTPKEKQIKISCTKCNNEICVSVTDEGVGISEENLAKLFRIDKKVKTIGTAGEKGTGLGLIICQEFIEKNKGSIKVNSTINSGSNFTFTLPSN